MKTLSRFIVRDLIPTRDDNDLFIKTINILWYRSKVKYFQNFPNHTCNNDYIHVTIPFVALMWSAELKMLSSPIVFYAQYRSFVY